MDRDEGEWLIRFREGDLEAFEKLVRAYQRRLLGFFRSLGADAQTAEDLTQETFLRIFGARESYTPDAPFRTFVFRIARNLWIDRYRARKVRPREDELEDGSGQEEPEERFESPVGGPLEEAARSEEIEMLRRAIEELPPKHREVLSLVAGQGLSHPEVAEILGIPVGTVKSRMHAAVRLLRGRWQSERRRARRRPRGGSV